MTIIGMCYYFRLHWLSLMTFFLKSSRRVMRMHRNDKIYYCTVYSSYLGHVRLANFFNKRLRIYPFFGGLKYPDIRLLAKKIRMEMKTTDINKLLWLQVFIHFFNSDKFSAPILSSLFKVFSLKTECINSAWLQTVPQLCHKEATWAECPFWLHWGWLDGFQGRAK